MAKQSLIETLIGTPSSCDEHFVRWDVSNGVAEFELRRHSSGIVDVLLVSTRPLLLARLVTNYEFFSLMLSLGIVNDHDCSLATSVAEAHANDMQDAIDAFCDHGDGSATAWKKQNWIAGLFKLRSQ